LASCCSPPLPLAALPRASSASSQAHPAPAETAARRRFGTDLGRLFGVALSILLTDAAVLITAEGIAAWMQFAPLADMARAGDGLGQIPLIQAIFTTGCGALFLLISLVLLYGIVWRGMRRSTSPDAPSVESR